MTTKDYETFFDPDIFLNTYYKDPKQMRFGYQQFAKFCNRQLKQKNLKFLNYGGGPVISRLISACPHVEDFIFAEYLECNRKAVQEWIDKHPKAFGWKPVFQFIVQELEGKGPDEVVKREGELRQKIKAVVSCDLTAENILEIPSNLADKYGPPYDVVFSGLCLEAVVESEQEYKDAVRKLAQLVKSGGYLIMHGVLQHTFYTLGAKKFYMFNMNYEMVMESMKNAGLKEIEITLASSDAANKTEIERSVPLSNFEDVFVAYGRA